MQISPKKLIFNRIEYTNKIADNSETYHNEYLFCAGSSLYWLQSQKQDSDAGNHEHLMQFFQEHNSKKLSQETLSQTEDLYQTARKSSMTNQFEDRFLGKANGCIYTCPSHFADTFQEISRIMSEAQKKNCFIKFDSVHHMTGLKFKFKTDPETQEDYLHVAFYDPSSGTKYKKLKITLSDLFTTDTKKKTTVNASIEKFLLEQHAYYRDRNTHNTEFKFVFYVKGEGEIPFLSKIMSCQDPHQLLMNAIQARDAKSIKEILSAPEQYSIHKGHRFYQDTQSLFEHAITDGGPEIGCIFLENGFRARDAREIELVLQNKALLHRYKSENLIDADKNTLLHLAIIHGCCDIDTLLEQVSTTIDSENNLQETPLCTAIRLGHHKTIVSLLNQPGEHRLESALCAAIAARQTRTVEMILTKVSEFEDPILFARLAIEYESKEIFDLLIKHLPVLREHFKDEILENISGKVAELETALRFLTMQDKRIFKDLPESYKDKLVLYPKKIEHINSFRESINGEKI